MLLVARKKRYRPAVEDWIQEHMNCWFVQSPCDEPCLGCKLCIPELPGNILVREMNVRGIEQMLDEGDQGFSGRQAQEGPGYTLLMNLELKHFLKQ